MDSLSEPPEEINPIDILILDLWPPGLKEYIYVVLSYLACDKLIQQLLESNTVCISYKQRHNIVIKIKELILIHHRILSHSVIPIDLTTYLKAEDPLSICAMSP